MKKEQFVVTHSFGAKIFSQFSSHCRNGLKTSEEEKKTEPIQRVRFATYLKSRTSRVRVRALFVSNLLSIFDKPMNTPAVFFFFTFPRFGVSNFLSIVLFRK